MSIKARAELEGQMKLCWRNPKPAWRPIAERLDVSRRLEVINCERERRAVEDAELMLAWHDLAEPFWTESATGIEREGKELEIGQIVASEKH